MLIPFKEIKFHAYRNVDSLKEELRRVEVPALVVDRSYTTLEQIPGRKPGALRRGPNVIRQDVIGVYSAFKRTTTFVRGDTFWHVRMSTPLSEERSRVLIDIFAGSRVLICKTPILPHHMDGVPGVGSGDWLACALEGLDALCALIDTRVHKKPDVVNVPELIAAKLLDNVGYVLHSS